MLSKARDIVGIVSILPQVEYFGSEGVEGIMTLISLGLGKTSGDVSIGIGILYPLNVHMML